MTTRKEVSRRFEESYLAQLTRAGLKPLSRIEWPVDMDTLSLFRHLGLAVGKIKQTAENGNVIEITVISTDPARVHEAQDIFDGQPLRLDGEIYQKWGKLLGIPQCCVEFFIPDATRHSPNGFSDDDLSLLYYWPCPDCSITKELIPRYRGIWESVNKKK